MRNSFEKFRMKLKFPDSFLSYIGKIRYIESKCHMDKTVTSIGITSYFYGVRTPYFEPRSVLLCVLAGCICFGDLDIPEEELDRARSRLYRRQNLQVNMRWN